MTFKKATPAVMAVLMAGPALAVDMGNGLSFNGDLGYELTSLTGGGDLARLMGELGLTWRNSGDGALGFGAKLEAVFARDAGSLRFLDATQLWGGAVVSTQFGDLTIGRPRALFSNLSDAPDLGNASYYEFEVGNDGISDTSYLDIISLNPNGTRYDIQGISFTGTQGAFSYGIALHEAVNNTFDINLTEMTLAYQAGALKYYGGLETWQDQFGKGQKTLIGAQVSGEKISYGGEVIASDFSEDNLTRIKLYANYAVSDQFDVGLQLGHINYPGFSDTAVGLSAEYSLANGGYAALGFLGNQNAALSDVYTAKFGVRF